MPPDPMISDSAIRTGTAAVMPAAGNIRVLQVFTVDQSIIFIAGQTEFLARNGIELSVAAADGPNAVQLRQHGIPTHAVPFTRAWSITADIRALRALYRIVRAMRPHIVHASTPKAGLLGTIAATIARVPARIYQMRGLPYTSESGARRIILKTAERIACSVATRVICVSRSLRDVALHDGIVSGEKAVVLGNGSGNGVDCFGRFDPARVPDSIAAAHRARLGIPADAFVFGFVGRFARSKGVVELHDAWSRLAMQRPDVHLVLVGEQDEREPVPELTALLRLPRVHHVPPTHRIEEWHAVFSTLVLPTWREGLSNVLLEAGSMGKPAVASDVVGCSDVVVDGETGLLVPPRDVGALERAMTAYVTDYARVRRHGAAARRRITAMFAPETVWKPLLGMYRDLANGSESER